MQRERSCTWRGRTAPGERCEARRVRPGLGAIWTPVLQLWVAGEKMFFGAEQGYFAPVQVGSGTRAARWGRRCRGTAIALVFGARGGAVLLGLAINSDPHRCLTGLARSALTKLLSQCFHVNTPPNFPVKTDWEISAVVGREIMS